MLNLVAAGLDAGTSLGSLLALQAPDAIDSGNAKLLMIFIGLVAFAILIVAIVAVVLAVMALRVEKKLMGYVDEIKAKAMPIIDKSNGLIADLSPEIKSITVKVNGITGHVQEIAGVVKDKVNEFAPTISAARMTLDEANQTAKDANQKTHAQVERVNGMISTALDATARMGRTIEHGITQPSREIAGIVSGVKAAMDSLMSKTRGFGAGITPNPNRTSQRSGK